MAVTQTTPDDPDHIPVELPLGKFLKWAIERNYTYYKAQLSKGEFVSPLFQFVRYLRAYPKLAQLSAAETFEVLSELPWQEVFPDSDDPEIEFLATWDKVRVAAGEDILDLAVARARERQLRLLRPLTESYSLVLDIAFQLQCLRPDDYITLPVERLGKILNRTARTVSYSRTAPRRMGTSRS